MSDDDDDDEFNGGDVRDLNNNIVNSDKENPSAPPLPTSMPFGEVNRVPSPPPNYSRLLNAPNSSTNKVQFRQSNVRNPINTLNIRESLIFLRSYICPLYYVAL